ncbi:MAG: hypothetical protein M3R66_05560 [Actinomycetota bacterium]|nr:hypothetical protein [Actinomycetota bacterium]
MSGTGSGPKGPGRRWWEIRGGREPDEGRYGDLVTGGRGRSRPERSLSIGTDPAEERRHPLHGFLWPVVSVVAVGALIVGGVYGVPKLTSEPASETTSRVEAAPGSEGDGSSIPPPPLGDLPGASALPPLGAGGIPGGSGEDPDGSAEDSGGNQGSQTTGGPTPGPNASAPVPFVKVDRPAPDAPGSQQDGTPVSGSGCTPIRTGGYACFVTQDAPAYRSGKSRPAARLSAGRYQFLCQSDGSEYSTGNRTNHWWAWAGDSSAGAWIPVVFLQGSKDDEPQPGLPVCGDEPTPTATSTSTPTSAPPETPYSSPPPPPASSSSASP